MCKLDNIIFKYINSIVESANKKPSVTDKKWHDEPFLGLKEFALLTKLHGVYKDAIVPGSPGSKGPGEALIMTYHFSSLSKAVIKISIQDKNGKLLVRYSTMYIDPAEEKNIVIDKKLSTMDVLKNIINAQKNRTGWKPQTT